MRIQRLRVEHVRKIRVAEVLPGPSLNVVFGMNGSGKTSLLETIHLLGNGHSFRTRRAAEIITEGKTSLSGFCEVIGAEAASSQIGIEKARGRTRIRVDGEDVRRTSVLARLLPTVFIGPECARLLEEAALRRRLLDWVMFHVEPRYLDVYHRYFRALRQRNAALRTGALPSSLSVWDQQLAEPGRDLHAARAKHAVAVSTFAAEFLGQLLPMQVRLDYQPGWDTTVPLEIALAEGRAADARLGYTRHGPHRADLALVVGDRAARSVLSRGESKLLAMGLLLAQGAYFLSHHGEPPVVLIDDLGTELDADSRTRFIHALIPLHAQAFVTTVVGQKDFLFPAEVRETEPVRQFHVEQGKIKEVI